MQAFNNEVGGIFLDASGEIVKTFQITWSLAAIQSKTDLAVTAFGIAATFLPGGITTHSALNLPVKCNSLKFPFATFPKHLTWEKFCRKCKYIVWDECSKNHSRLLTDHCKICMETSDHLRMH